MKVEKTNSSTYLVTFHVKGRGDFPVDMLRYDQCFPVTEKDSASIKGGAYSQPKPERVVTVAHLGSSKVWKPTIGRWNSFGWDVVILME